MINDARYSFTCQFMAEFMVSNKLDFPYHPQCYRNTLEGILSAIEHGTHVVVTELIKIYLLKMKTESYQRHIENIRWPVKTRCVFCCSIITDTSVCLYKNGWKVYHCPECKKDFTVLSNSTLERSKLNPRQLWVLFYLIKYDKLNPPSKEPVKGKPFQGVPSALARRLGVHHWTMTKIMNRVKGKTPEELLNRHGIAGLEEALTRLFTQGDDKENIPLAILLCTYKFITHDPRGLRAISGCSTDFVQKAVERIKESWEPGKEFEEDEHNWYDPDWKEKTEMILVLHCLCIKGEIKRNPITKTWSLKNELSNNNASTVQENASRDTHPVSIG